MAELQLLVDDVVIKSFPLDKAVIGIGRGQDNDIIIDEESVSGHHAKIELIPNYVHDGALLVDLHVKRNVVSTRTCHVWLHFSRTMWMAPKQGIFKMRKLWYFASKILRHRLAKWNKWKCVALRHVMCFSREKG